MFGLFRKRDTKNRAFTLYSEYGPRMSDDPIEKLSSKFPNLTEDTIRNWIEEFSEVESMVWEITQDWSSPGMSDQVAYDRFAERFPFLDRASLKQCVARSHREAWYNGYL